jgi:hypothetical protein
MTKVTEQQVRDRLVSQFGPDEIDSLIEKYRETNVLTTPDMDAITRLAQKGQEENLLKVNFRLTQEQYDALVAYYKEPGQAGTYLVQRAIQEFIALV